MSENNHFSTKGDILIVDDTPANLRLLAGMLTEQDYKVRPVPNGELAIKAVRAAPPELILLDINMPDMDGYQVASHLKADEISRDIPIIFISALNETEDKVKAFQAGGVDYVTKPFQFEEVLARVETHLTIQRLQRELQHHNALLEQQVQARTAELWDLNQSLDRFVPNALLAYLGKKSIIDIKLGDQVQGDMAVMFSDVRGFTALLEGMSPQESFRYLNDYLGQVSPVIRENHGFIDKYLGDGLMSIFPTGPQDAVKSAVRMRYALAEHNKRLESRGLAPIRIGTGINAGKVMLGVIGEEQRVQGTAISDAVNVASRLEGLTKQYGIAIAVCQGVVKNIDPEEYHFRFMDRVKVKGRAQTMNVFEIFDGDPPEKLALKQQTKAIFEQGLNAYFSRQFSEASQAFEQVLAANPDDELARIHLERARRYAKKGLPDDWAGVELMQVK